jgi:hypothetical protein
MRQNKKTTILILALTLMAVLPLASAANWQQGPNWNIGSNWNPLTTYTITVTSPHGTPTASGTVAAGASYPTSVTSPDTQGYVRYNCTGYQIDGGALTPGTSYTFTSVSASHTIVYSWTTQYLITPSNDSHSTTSPPTAQWCNASTSQTFTYSAAAGYAIAHVYIDGADSAITGSYTFTSISASHTIQVTTSQNVYPIIASAGTGGSISPSGTTIAAQGSSQTYSINASIGNHLTTLFVDGSPVTPASSYTFTNIQASHTITANFALDVFYITSSADSNANVLPNGITAANYGSSLTVYYSANDGYEIINVTVDSQPASISSVTGDYTFTNIQANHTIAVASSLINTPTPTPTPTPTHSNRPTTTETLYMRSDQYNVTGLTGYGLDTDYTNTAQTLTLTETGNITVYYGFRVYIYYSPLKITELTSGTPIAILSADGNFTGQLSNVWNFPGTTVTLGYQALKVSLYASTDNQATWSNQADYLTNILITNYIAPSTWTFSLQMNVIHTSTDTTSSFSFGDTNNRSTISNIVIQNPLESEIQAWRISRGDYVGFELGAYMDILGEGFYAAILILIGGVLFFRYGHGGVILFLFSIFGGAGGLIFLLIPPWTAPIVGVIIVLSLTFLTWRLIR